ncbi:MAG: O-antigen ligase family protein, partial [Egibacteraceae bacterium]
MEPTGLALAAATGGWAVVSGWASGGDPGPLLALLVLIAAAAALGWVSGHAHPWAGPAAVVAWAAAVALRDLPRLYGGPLDTPLGYSNATAAFFVLASAAGVMVAARATGRVVRLGGLAAAVAFATVPLRNGSLAGAVLVCLLLPLAAVARLGPRAVGRLVAACGVTVAAAVALTIVVGLNYDAADRGRPLDRGVDATLTERRAVLWSDALALMRAAPETGVGPGRFRAYSPTALADDDAAWAHSGYLQMGAETGLVGFTLTCALVGWGFAWLRRGPLDGGTAVAARALAAAGVHGAVDYVWQLPADVGRDG